MKNITWIEIAIATPMILAFSSIGGWLTVGVTSAVMIVVMAVLKWSQRKRTVVVETNP